MTIMDARGFLEDAWAQLGGDPSLTEGVELTGPGDVLPSAFPVTDMLQGSVAAVALAASELATARAGRAPRAAVDSRAVAVAAHSELHLRVRGEAVGVWDPLSGFARAADGWVRLHANYAHHRARLLRVLDIPEDRAALERAVAALPAQEIEDRLAAVGALGFVVRTPEEWAAHPQARVVAGLPLLDVTEQAGVGIPRWENPGAADRPTAGLRVLDLTRVLAGPTATRTLGVLGADVLRIDPPAMPEGPFYADTGLCKRTALLDLDDAAGRARLDELLAGADVLVLGYRSGALARFGLGRDTIAERHPHLVVVELSAWGHAGPWAGRRGFDSLVQAASGIDVVEGRARGDADRPGVLPAQALDHTAGYLAAAAALRGLTRRLGTGRPTWTRLSLAGTARWLSASYDAGPASGAAVPSLDPAPWLTELDSGFGRLVVARPPFTLDGATPQWWRASRPLGSDRAEWGSGTGV